MRKKSDKHQFQLIASAHNQACIGSERLVEVSFAARRNGIKIVFAFCYNNPEISFAKSPIPFERKLAEATRPITRQFVIMKVYLLPHVPFQKNEPRFAHLEDF